LNRQEGMQLTGSSPSSIINSKLSSRFAYMASYKYSGAKTCVALAFAEGSCRETLITSLAGFSCAAGEPLFACASVGVQLY